MSDTPRVGFALQPDEAFLSACAPLLVEDVDYYEVTPETMWRPTPGEHRGRGAPEAAALAMGFEPEAYLERLDLDRVIEIHVDRRRRPGTPGGDPADPRRASYDQGGGRMNAPGDRPLGWQGVLAAALRAEEPLAALAAAADDAALSPGVRRAVRAALVTGGG